MISDGNNGMVMPVGPMYGAGYGGGNGAFGGDWSSWILLFLIAMMFGNNGWGNNGNSGANGQFPWLLASGQRTDDNVQAGFNQAATAGQLTAIQNSINTGFANAEVANCNRALTDLQANYQAQLNNLTGLNNVSMGLQNCCCENRQSIADLKATILQEGCADRNAVQNALRDVLTAQQAGIQSIKDQMCADKIDAKNEKIAELQQQLNFANLMSSQNAQTAAIQAGQRALANEVEQYVRPTPNPAYIVQNPNCCYNQTGCGCGSFVA